MAIDHSESKWRKPNNIGSGSVGIQHELHEAVYVRCRLSNDGAASLKNLTVFHAEIERHMSVRPTRFNIQLNIMTHPQNRTLWLIATLESTSWNGVVDELDAPQARPDTN